MLPTQLSENLLEQIIPLLQKNMISRLRLLSHWNKQQIDCIWPRHLDCIQTLNHLSPLAAKKFGSWYKTTPAWKNATLQANNNMNPEMVICFALLTQEKIMLPPNVIMTAMTKYGLEGKLNDSLLRHLHIIIAAAPENDTKCDLISLPSPPTPETLNTLAISSKAAYVLSQNQLFYVHQIYGECRKIETSQQNIDYIEEVQRELSDKTLDEKKLYFITFRTMNMHKNKASQLPPLLMQTQNPFLNINLAGRDLQKINLCLFPPSKQRINLNEANLAAVNLKDASLENVDLIRADLSGADLTGTNLTKANLTGANLNKINLTHAKLDKTRIFQANFSDAQFLDIFDDLIPSLDNLKKFLDQIQTLKFATKKMLRDAIAKDIVRQLQNSHYDYNKKKHLLTICRSHTLFQPIFALGFVSHFVKIRTTSQQILLDYEPVLDSLSHEFKIGLSS
jgi:uncharacterized protein YjbI with pentapeptide repeats